MDRKHGNLNSHHHFELHGPRNIIAQGVGDLVQVVLGIGHASRRSGALRHIGVPVVSITWAFLIADLEVQLQIGPEMGVFLYPLEGLYMQ